MTDTTGDRPVDDDGTSVDSGEDRAVHTEQERLEVATRLREARELLGLTQADVAAALGVQRTSIHAMEAGKRNVNGVELRRLARLYRRPVEWLLGVDSPPPAADALYRLTEKLSEADQQQVVRFAEFLAAAGTPPRRRARTAEPGQFADPVIDPGDTP
jgi:transcriptional regulator with XRE-family HTH domain